MIKYAQLMVLILTVAASVFHFMGLFGGHVNPIGNLSYALMVFMVPAFIIFNTLLLIYWLLRKSYYIALIPAIPLLFSIYFIGGTYQLGGKPSRAMDRSGIVIASYNVGRFGHSGMATLLSQEILAVMKKHEVDIICFQEYKDDEATQHIREMFKKDYPYCAFGKDDMVIFSKYPITSSKAIRFEQTNNSAMLADISVEGNKWHVYNVHMETTGINSALYGNKSDLLKTNGNSYIKSLMLKIYGNYTNGLMVRAGQATTIANDINMNYNQKSIILCGDFNDVPNSYVYRMLKGELIDGFRECGSGMMTTYRGKGLKNMRIDYIMHSEDIKGVTYYNEDLTYSDHTPVFMKLKN